MPMAKSAKAKIWKQESIVGSVFEGSVKVRDGKVYPSIKGSAFVNAEAELVLDPAIHCAWASVRE